MTENLTNPTFDFTVEAKNFQPINASNKDNELFYGKVKMDADLIVGGNLKVPVIKGNLAVKEGTDFTFVVPESQVDGMERGRSAFRQQRKSRRYPDQGRYQGSVSPVKLAMM